ncbi:MAG: nuclear transport factor 2 family protein [Pedobacter sp.]|nr:MAG: nuclear transport factor 2 family protein [Pedobacter sp.]
MNDNQNLISHFYSCFQNKDVKGMQDCYAEDAIFNDPVFSNLNATQTKAMWAMLIEKGKDLTLQFENVRANEYSGSANWTATYTFSLTGNTVVNVVQADFTFKNGRIQTHTDRFSFYKWSSQALGITGKLLGWTPLIKNKIRLTAIRNLKAYMGSDTQTL